LRILSTHNGQNCLYYKFIDIRFDADRSDNGHADRFWALALALHAAGNGTGEIHISSRQKFETLKLVKDF